MRSRLRKHFKSLLNKPDAPDEEINMDIFKLMEKEKVPFHNPGDLEVVAKVLGIEDTVEETTKVWKI